MYINKEQLNKRLTGAEKEKEPRKAPIRLNTTEAALVGHLVNESGSAKEIAKVFDISTNSAKNYSKGITTPALGINPEVKEKLEEHQEASKATKASATSDAIEVLIAALGKTKHLVPNINKATDAASVASSMANIVDRLDGSNKENSGPKVAVIIHSPATRKEEDYEIIEVGR